MKNINLLLIAIFSASLVSCGGTSEIKYTFYTDFTCSVSSNTNYGGNEVIIPSEVMMGGDSYKVTFVEANAFLNNKRIKKLVLPSSVTVSGYDSFKGCTSLESVDFSNGIEVIPDHMFQGCKNLKTVVGLDNCKTIYNGAFESCNLTSIGFKNIEYIGVSNFFNNPNLKDVRLLGSYTTLPGSSFELCPKLDFVVLSSTCSSIGEYAFKNCTSLTNFDFANINYISRNAFENCNLEEVALKNTAIELNGFINNDNLKKVDLENSFISYRSFYDSDELKEVKINNCSSIGSQAFKSCDIEKLSLSGNISVIESEAFEDNELTSLDLSKTQIKSIHRRAFYDNELNGILDLPSSLEKIYYQAFAENDIEEVKCYSSTMIDESVFDKGIKVTYL